MASCESGLQQYEHRQLLQGLWITRDLTANPFAVHGQANAEEKAISGTEKLVLELTRAVAFMFLLLWHKALVIETFPKDLLMGALASAFSTDADDSLTGRQSCNDQSWRIESFTGYA